MLRLVFSNADTQNLLRGRLNDTCLYENINVAGNWYLPSIRKQQLVIHCVFYVPTNTNKLSTLARRLQEVV